MKTNLVDEGLNYLKSICEAFNETG